MSDGLELGSPTSLNFLTNGRDNKTSENVSISQDLQSDFNRNDFEAINQFFFKKLTYFVSAEINNPLTVINSHIHDLQSSIDKKTINVEQLQASLDRITYSNHKIGRILKQLRNLSESENTRSKPQPTFLKQIITETLDLCQNRFLQHQMKVFQMIDPKVIVMVRPQEIMQILIHIIENAIQANSDKTNSWLQIEAHKENSVVTLSIWDSGASLLKSHLTTSSLESLHGLNVGSYLAKENQGSLKIISEAGVNKLNLQLQLFRTAPI